MFFLNYGFDCFDDFGPNRRNWADKSQGKKCIV